MRHNGKILPRIADYPRMGMRLPVFVERLRPDMRQLLDQDVIEKIGGYGEW